jgi:hypothetical protein
MDIPSALRDDLIAFLMCDSAGRVGESGGPFIRRIAMDAPA